MNSWRDLGLWGLMILLLLANTPGFTNVAASAPISIFPFRAEDLDKTSIKIYWGRPEHSPSGVQKHGYDLGALRYDSRAKKWTELTVSDDAYKKNKTNDRWLIYGIPIHAMRDGKVIACWRNAPENTPGTHHAKIGEGYVYGGGNGFWIEHSDGTRAEYAHMIPGTVPSSLCPHNETLLPKKIASPAVENAWPQIKVPAAKQVTIKAGQFLGNVGNAGTSSAPHLHIHVEQGGTAGDVKSGGSPVSINFQRGLAAPRNDSSAAADWKSFSGKPIPPGPALVWPPRTLTSEFAQHGFPSGGFQAIFDHLTNSAYWLTWIDTYSVGGKNYINHVWRPAAGPWRAHVLVTAKTHQDKIDQNWKDGYAAVNVESSVYGGQARYSAVFVKGRPNDILMRHGITVKEHDKELASASKRNLSPVSISVISLGGNRYYTVLYRPEKVTGWLVKSQIPESDYQAMYDDNLKAGRKPVYLNSYMHGGKPYISAIFANKANEPRKDRHLMSQSTYQDEWASAMKAGMLTRAVTSVDGAKSQHRLAAAWWK